MKNSAKNIALKQELERYLNRFGEVKQEVTFSKIMDTTRRYRADYLLLDHLVIIELNGGQWTGGRHTRAGKVKGKKCTQYEDDLNKINLAQKHGFKIFQFTYEQLQRKEYVEILELIK